MRFHPFASVALVSVLALGACTTPHDTTRSAQTLKKIEKQFGTTDPSDMKPLYKSVSEDGSGFTMFRVYSEKPLPSRFSRDVPETFENALVLDLGVETKLHNGFPLYRVALKPRKISMEKVWEWPSHVLLKGEGADGETKKIAAKLPADRTPDASGMIWTDWTYCADCVNLRGIETASVDALSGAFEHFDAAAAAALAPNGAALDFDETVQFVAVPGVGILTGNEAHEMSTIAMARVDLARKRARMAGPARRAYEDMVEAFSHSMSPSNAIVKACGTYEPNQDRIVVDVEKERFDAYASCAGKTLAQFPSGKRQKELKAYAAQEAHLAKKAGLSDAGRKRPYTLSYEIEQAGGMIEQMRELFIESVQDEVGMGVATKLKAQGVENRASLSEAAALTGAAVAPKPLPKAIQDAVTPEPSSVDYLYVARAIEDGASRKIGSTSSCLGNIECEVGRVVPLIAVEKYCENPEVAEKSITPTIADWGMVIERYKPMTKADEMLLRSAERPEPLYSVAKTDTGAFDAALKRLNTYNSAEGVDFFPTYQAFYKENTDVRACKDAWRDSALHKVSDN